MTDEMCSLQLLQELGYVSLIFRRPDGSDAAVFTVHRVEATKLAERLAEVVNAGDGAHSLVEGAHLGGPPRPDQLLAPK